MKVSRVTTNNNKRKMIEVLPKNDFVVKAACNIVGIHESTHYRWMKLDRNYANKYKQRWEYIQKREDESFARSQEKFFGDFWEQALFSKPKF